MCVNSFIEDGANTYLHRNPFINNDLSDIDPICPLP